MAPQWKKRIALLLFLLLLAAFLLGSSAILRPKEHHLGGIDWPSFRKEPRDSIDVLFMGSSFCFTNVIPAKIYQDTGYTAYIMGASEMPIALGWHYLNEGLKRQSPDIAVMEVGYLGAGNYTAYPEVKVGYMPYFSINRFAAVFDCAAPEYRKGLLFPLYSYHSKWTTITANDIRTSFQAAQPSILAGCGLSGTVAPQVRQAGAPLDASSAAFGINRGYLARIAALCEKRDITLVLFTAPNCVPYDEAGSEAIREIVCVSDSVRYIDGNAHFADIGLDPATDYADEYHMNYSGATKFSAFLARYLTQFAAEITPKNRDDALWAERVAYYTELPAMLAAENAASDIG